MNRLPSVIILAAGQGSRLRPLTDDCPKCLVPYRGKPMLEYILEAIRSTGIDGISVVSGYKAERLRPYNLSEFHNRNYATTNMVASLFCARDAMVGDLVISYSDIIYRSSVVESLIASEAEFSVVVDRAWEKLWLQRMEDLLSDAETLKLNADGTIQELGNRPRSREEVEGQYIGLIKIKGSAIGRVKAFYDSLDRSADYQGRSFDQMYMTTFIQLIIDRLMPVTAVLIDGGWLEVDSVEDLASKMVE